MIATSRLTPSLPLRAVKIEATGGDNGRAWGAGPKRPQARTWENVVADAVYHGRLRLGDDRDHM
jgi:hypothetical protein